jgi:hypothetical protein
VSMVWVKMVQQMSGQRGDGREWPPAGVDFEVDAEEARFLTRTADGSSTPLAVYAERRTETADAKARPVETREEKPAMGGVLPGGSSQAENKSAAPERVDAPAKQSRPGAGKSRQ